MRFFQHVLSLREIERTGQLDAWLERFDAIDGHLATARGPWSDGPFVSAVLRLLASAPERAA
jgi:hypothetical protein